MQRFQVGNRVRLTEKERRDRIKRFGKDLFPGNGTVIKVDGRNTHFVHFDQQLWNYELEPDEEESEVELRGPDWRHRYHLPGSALERAEETID
jgi:hypothetical protein